MSRVPGWLDRLGAGISKLGEQLDERRAQAERDTDDGPAPPPAPAAAPDSAAARDAAGEAG
ncbi:AI-2E family transporter, partial [Streptomyces sp. SID5785]|nr:AI-2E family transporter [Streptomyces sp. SID5785]